MLANNMAFKYYTPYKVPFDITQCWINGVVSLQYGAVKIRYNVHSIKPYTSDTNLEYVKCLELTIGGVILGNYQLYAYVYI